MKMRIRLILLCVVGAMASASQAEIVNTFDRGWYTSSGRHRQGNDNYFVGENDGLRNFFAFALPSAPSGQEVISASLSTFTALVQGDSTVTLRDYIGNIDALTAGAAGPAGYNDLGNGTVFGSRDFFDDEDNVFVSYTLNASAIAAINAGLGNNFVIGGRSSSVSSDGVYSGSETGDPADGRTFLDLTFGPIPAPGAATLGLIGIPLVGWLKRRVA